MNTFNALVRTTGNVSFGAIGGKADFESVLLHEMGHSLGLGHVNLASESGLAGPGRNFTKSGDGGDNTFNLGIGADGVRGSSDDIRGDDVNLNYFEKATNNPFLLAASGIVDSTTYSMVLGDLPAGHSFSANAGRAVGALLGFPNTEAVFIAGDVF